jgi:hypothetical protein
LLLSEFQCTLHKELRFISSMYPKFIFDRIGLASDIDFEA